MIRCGVVANIIASHAIARGSIPRVGIPFFLPFSLRTSIDNHVCMYVEFCTRVADNCQTCLKQITLNHPKPRSASSTRTFAPSLQVSKVSAQQLQSHPFPASDLPYSPTTSFASRFVDLLPRPAIAVYHRRHNQGGEAPRWTRRWPQWLSTPSCGARDRLACEV